MPPRCAGREGWILPGGEQNHELNSCVVVEDDDDNGGDDDDDTGGDDDDDDIKSGEQLFGRRHK